MELVGKVSKIEKDLRGELTDVFFIEIEGVTVFTNDLDVLHLCIEALINKLTVKISYEENYLTITRIIIQSN